MPSFGDYQADTGFNNLVIQRALCEVDTGVLITAMVGLPEDIRSMFYRNMSRRTGDLCREDIASRGSDTSVSISASSAKARIEAAQAVVLQLLHKYGEQAEGEEFQPDRGDIPEIRLHSPDAIIDTFRSLASYVRKNGFLTARTTIAQNSGSFWNTCRLSNVDCTNSIMSRDSLSAK